MRWRKKKLLEQLAIDTAIYGTCFVAVHWRKWWNPMRLFLGPYKWRRISPDAFYRVDELMAGTILKLTVLFSAAILLTAYFCSR